MTDYAAKTGSNVALVSLTTLDPQPHSDGIKCTRRAYGADGTVIEEGLYVELEWNVVKDPTQYQAILTVFGLSASVKMAAVTVYVPDQTRAFVRMNGNAIRPEVGRDMVYNNAHPRNVTIVVRDLATAS